MHKYYKEIMAMAEAAKISERPWEILQWCWSDAQGKDKWFDCKMSPFDEYLNIPIDKFIRIKPKEKKKLWLWHKVDYVFNVYESCYRIEGVDISDAYWHKTNTFIEIEGE